MTEFKIGGRCEIYWSVPLEKNRIIESGLVVGLAVSSFCRRQAGINEV